MTEDFPEYNMSDPDQVEMAKEADRQRTLDQTQFVVDQMRSYQGRAFVSMLLQEANVEGSSFSGEQTHTTAYLEGKQDLGKWARNLVLTTVPEMFILMRREVVEREQRYALGAGLGRDANQEE